MMIPDIWPFALLPRCAVPFSINLAADRLKFNQLQTRKKQLAFPTTDTPDQINTQFHDRARSSQKPPLVFSADTLHDDAQNQTQSSYAWLIQQSIQIRSGYLRMYQAQRQNVESTISHLQKQIQSSIERLRLKQEDGMDPPDTTDLPLPNLSGKDARKIQDSCRPNPSTPRHGHTQTHSQTHTPHLISKRHFLEFARASSPTPGSDDSSPLKILQAPTEKISDQPADFAKRQLPTRKIPVLHLDLSRQNYMNFINLLSVLYTLFQNKLVAQDDLDSLCRSERAILKSYLVRKGLLDAARPLPADKDFYNRRDLFRSAKRKEEKLKFVLSLCVQCMRLRFDRGAATGKESQMQEQEQEQSESQLQSQTPQSKTKSRLKPGAHVRDLAFYAAYFGGVARAKDVQLSAFFLPGSGRNQNRARARPQFRTINKVYVSLLKQSQPFLADLTRILRGDYVDTSGRKTGLEAIWRQKLLDKLKNKLTGWNALIARVGESAGLTRICRNIETNPRYVMPWSKCDLAAAVKQVEEVLLS